jgi:hypothetical protein
MSSSPDAAKRKQHPNRGMLQVIGLTVIATVSIILFTNDAWLAVTLSASVMAIIVGVVFFTISSILFVGLKERNIFLATAMVGVAIASIISLFAEIFVWIGVSSGNVCLNVPLHFATAIYFSIVTWTTVGYGDLVPCGSGRLVAALEAILGYLVMALLIATLVESISEVRKNAGG